jgi:predicted GNAT family acetyltransferase
MATQVRATDVPELVLREAQTFLESDPVRHNIILTLLNARVAAPEPGRYWMVDIDGRSAGVVFQSPIGFFATATPMPDEAVIAVVDAIVDQGVVLPGITGEAATAARFAGQWAEHTRSAAHPVQGQRIYEVDDVVEAAPVSGQLRLATDGDRDPLVAWVESFQAEIGEAPSPAAPTVDRRLASGELWIWDDGAPVSMLGLSGALAGVVRIGPVFTPPDRRAKGYASALVAAVSSAARASGHRCILYTDLSNPTSNAIYRAIGYRAVAEALRYEFDAASPSRS